MWLNKLLITYENLCNQVFWGLTMCHAGSLGYSRKPDRDCLCPWELVLSRREMINKQAVDKCLQGCPEREKGATT